MIKIKEVPSFHAKLKMAFNKNMLSRYNYYPMIVTRIKGKGKYKENSGIGKYTNAAAACRKACTGNPWRAGFWVKNKNENGKTVKCKADSVAILSVFHHPAPGGGLSIPKWPFFQIHGSKLKLHPAYLRRQSRLFRQAEAIP